MTLEGPRMLNKSLGGCNAPTDGSSTVLPAPTGMGWVSGDPAIILTPVAIQRSYFDMSGYNRQGLTSFFQGVEFQYAGPPSGSDNVMQVLDLITTEFIDDEEIQAIVGGPPGATGVFSGPGFPPSTNNQEQVIYGRRRVYTSDAGTGQATFPNLHSVDTWGTCNATTADKLHITRIMIPNTVSTLHFVPDVNVVISIIVAQEKDLAFLMRQKRSYELATGP